MPKREKDLLEEDALAALFNQPGDSRLGIRNRAIMVLLYDAAIRVGELTGLRVRDVNLKSMSVHKDGERLYLEGVVTAMATSEQAEAMETDDREGLLRTYLDTLLPENWDSMSLYDRRNFLNGSEFGDAQRTGTVRWMIVCNMEIWCECFGRESSALKKIDSYEISGIMRKIEGWVNIPQQKTELQASRSTGNSVRMCGNKAENNGNKMVYAGTRLYGG